MTISPRTLIMAAVVLTLNPLASQAQQLEEVIVTAQKRSESPQDMVGVEAAQILEYTYKRRFGVSLQMDW